MHGSASELRVRFGKLGSAGRVTTKALAAPEAAAREAEKLVREKIKGLPGGLSATAVTLACRARPGRNA